jgi:hypothetical protein
LRRVPSSASDASVRPECGKSMRLSFDRTATDRKAQDSAISNALRLGSFTL